MLHILGWVFLATLGTISVTQIAAILFLSHTGQDLTREIVIGNIVFPSITAIPISMAFFYHRSKLKVLITKLDAANALLKDRSDHDGLTGLLHRSAFFERLSERRRATDTGAFMMVDVDHFKSINDTFGHVAGDQVLKRVAATIADAVRSGDIVARYGGEEFCVFCAGADLKIGTMVGERIRSSVEALSFPIFKGERSVTVSIGIAECQERSSDSEIALSKADEALYQAKRTGRNKVVVAA